MRGKDTFGDRQPPVIERRRFLVQAEVQKVLNVLDGDEKERAETLAFIKEDIRKDKELLNAEADKELSGLPEEQTDLQFAVFQTLEKYFSSLYQNFFLDVQLDGDTYKSHPDILEIYEDIRDIIEKYSDAFGKRFLFFLGKCGLDPATGINIFRDRAVWDAFICYYYLPETEKEGEAEIIDRKIAEGFRDWLRTNLHVYLSGTSQTHTKLNVILRDIAPAMVAYRELTEEEDVNKKTSEFLVDLIETERDTITNTLLQEAVSQADRKRIEEARQAIASREQIVEQMARIRF